MNVYVDLLDYPGIVIPVGATVDPVLDPIDAQYEAVSDRDAKVQESCAFLSVPSFLTVF